MVLLFFPRPACRPAARLLLSLLFPLLPCLPAAAAAQPALPGPLHQFVRVAIAPDGTRVASVERDEATGDAPSPETLHIRGTGGGDLRIAPPCSGGAGCTIGALRWSPDGRELVFLVSRDGGADPGTDIERVAATGGAVTTKLHFAGPLDDPRFGPNGALAVLATAQAHKALGRASAAAPLTGEIGSATDEQRIALVENGTLRFVSPADLYVYQFDWRPDGGFVGTAAHGDGDQNWWIAGLWSFGTNEPARLLFQPGAREQLADPVVSPDGRGVAFIGGWMSDFGSFGGDAFLLPLDHTAAPRNLTPGSHATITALDWHCGEGLTGVALSADRVSLLRLDRADRAPLWSGRDTLSAGGFALSVSCSPHAVAAIASGFTRAPELVAGPIGHWQALTHDNDAAPAPFSARSVEWRNDGQSVQGWLLQPDGAAPPGGRAMVVLVHGGPEAAAMPSFPAASSTVRALLAQNWDVFEPNYRGSFGQGEVFASGSIGDLGGGDWRDVLSGVDAAERAAAASGAAVDDSRLAIMGGSYGGYMTMWAVTQTHRFRAGASHAGVSDWLSIEGEAPQAGSDQVNFGGSVYDDTRPYLRSSPITHMRGVSTPVLVTVGERDAECPMPQSQEFATALTALGVPNQFVVYAGEGHGFSRRADREDELRRTIAWFTRFLAPR